MTLPERLRAAASAERLSDWVKYYRMGIVCWRNSTHSEQGSPYRPLCWVRGWAYPSQKWWVSLYGNDGWTVTGPCHPTREAAIRAGLLALAEREEARG